MTSYNEEQGHNRYCGGCDQCDGSRNKAERSEALTPNPPPPSDTPPAEVTEGEPNWQRLFEVELRGHAEMTRRCRQLETELAACSYMSELAQELGLSPAAHSSAEVTPGEVTVRLTRLDAEYLERTMAGLIGPRGRLHAKLRAALEGRK